MVLCYTCGKKTPETTTSRKERKTETTGNHSTSLEKRDTKQKTRKQKTVYIPSKV
jgi:hypothetical protein